MKNKKNIKLKNIIVFLIALLAMNSAKAGDLAVEKVQSASIVAADDPRMGQGTSQLLGFEIGVRYMPLIYSLEMRTYDGATTDGSAKFSTGFGAMLAFNMGKHIGVQGEVDYFQMSQKYKDRGLEQKININYVNIPVMLSLNSNKTSVLNVNVVVGPQFGVNVGSNINTTGSQNSDTLRAVVAVKKGDVGLAYGAGLQFSINDSHTICIDLGYRGFYGLINMDASADGKDTYNVIVKTSRKAQGGYIGLTFRF